MFQWCKCCSVDWYIVLCFSDASVAQYRLSLTDIFVYVSVMQVLLSWLIYCSVSVMQVLLSWLIYSSMFQWCKCCSVDWYIVLCFSDASVAQLTDILFCISDASVAQLTDILFYVSVMQVLLSWLIYCSVSVMQVLLSWLIYSSMFQWCKCCPVQVESDWYIRLCFSDASVAQYRLSLTDILFYVSVMQVLLSWLIYSSMFQWCKCCSVDWYIRLCFSDAGVAQLTDILFYVSVMQVLLSWLIYCSVSVMQVLLSWLIYCSMFQWCKCCSVDWYIRLCFSDASVAQLTDIFVCVSVMQVLLSWLIYSSMFQWCKCCPAQVKSDWYILCFSDASVAQLTDILFYVSVMQVLPSTG